MTALQAQAQQRVLQATELEMTTRFELNSHIQEKDRLLHEAEEERDNYISLALEWFEQAVDWKNRHNDYQRYHDQHIL
eukprot:12894254-Prorocentrum_lima.AAC.1